MKKMYPLLLLGLLSFVACRKTPDLSRLSTAFIVQTAKGDGASFNQYKTYFISDTISLITDKPTDSIWFDADAKKLVDAVKQNMSARGFTFVPRAGNPELAFGLIAVKNLNVGVIYPGWWWGGYWGGCYWGYCGYPPYYGWGYPVYYTVTTGTLIEEIIDLKNVSADQKFSVLWDAVSSGSLDFGNNIQLSVDAINQSFAQSTYIQAK